MRAVLPKTSRIAVFQGPGKGFTLEEHAIPELHPGEMLVRINLCTVCGSDLHTFQGHRPGPVPGALGHEITGRLAALGPGCTPLDYTGKPLNPGDRITWLLYSFNPDDPMSQRGLPQKSVGMFKYGHESIIPGKALHSGFADYIILRPGTPVFRIPQALSNLVATPANCTFATAMASIRLAAGIEGKKVAVFGCGMMGYFAMAVASTRGAKSITGIDTDTERVKRARLFGADRAIPFSGEPDMKYDLIFEMSGAPVAMERAVRQLGIGGQAIFAGAAFPQDDFQVNGETLVRNILTIRGIHNYHPDDLGDAIRFLQLYPKSFPFSDLVEAIYPLDQINEAFEYAITKKPVRVAVNPNE